MPTTTTSAVQIPGTPRYVSPGESILSPWLTPSAETEERHFTS